MSMRSQTEAMRALAYVAAAALDKGRHHPEPAERQRNQALVDLLTPIVKGWCTEQAVEIASIGIQVHGGTGFVEESGAAQYLRDARITTIYEGTTGIQANDLVGRKIARDGGDALAAAIDEMRQTESGLMTAGDASLAVIGTRLRAGLDALADAAGFVVRRYRDDPRSVLAGSVPLLELAGIVCGGAQLGRAALIATTKLAAKDGDAGFLRAKIATARHFADHVLTHAPALRDTVVEGSSAMLAIADEQL
jgi:hypothetical protein